MQGDRWHVYEYMKRYYMTNGKHPDKATIERVLKRKYHISQNELAMGLLEFDRWERECGHYYQYRELGIG
jgi:hypothetical protein